MILDSSEIPRDRVVECDVCIVGAGMSGISVALRMLGRGLNIVMLEGGGESPEPASKALTAGPIVGQPYYPLDDARPRLLGGSTNYWAGWCRPIDRVDVEGRPWIAMHEWPIAWREIERYLPAAKELVEIPDASFDPEDLSGLTPTLYRPPFAAGPVHPTVWVASPPTKFGVTYRSRLAEAQDLQLILHANVTNLEAATDGRRIYRANVRTLQGNAFGIQARSYIMCAGAMETARILLNSKLGQRQGIGNEHDNVGRYFMEHPHVVTGRLVIDRDVTTNRPRVDAVDGRLLRGAKARLAMERPEKGVKFAYTLRPEAMERHKLLNWSAHLRTVSRLRGGPEVFHAMKLMVGNLRSVRTLLTQIRRGQLPRGLAKQLLIVASHPDDVVRVAYQQLWQRPRSFEVYVQAEQSPNRSSRVTLAAETDALGVPRVKLDWRLTDVDKRSIRTSQQIVSDQLLAAGLGRIVPEPWLEDPEGGWGDGLRGGFHHMGTARMGADPKTSVVDADQRVHSMVNLWVGDTSVMPTSGYANPLLTGVALAVRVADVVMAELGAP